MPDKPIVLNDEPKNKELEEYISAYFQASGYYIERNIIEREISEVLELDIILTDYSNDIPESILVEIKSGGWGFPEIFKVLGWKNYLNIEKAIFISSKDKGSSDVNSYYIDKSKDIGVNLVIIEDYDKTQQYLQNYLSDKTVETIDITLYRFSYLIERLIMEKLIKKKKTSGEIKRYKLMSDYYHNINNNIFFTNNTLDRIGQLYDQFKAYPDIIACVSNEISNNQFEPLESIDPTEFNKAFYNSEFTDLTIASYLDYRSRQSIIKNVIDFINYRKADPECPEAKRTIDMLGFPIDRFDLLPNELEERILQLETHAYVSRYAYFWQVFIWLFGGFILLDYTDKEYELLSDKTGIPIDKLDEALSSYDIIFPTEKGWFFTPSNSNIKQLKLFPSLFMGIGVNLRVKNYTEDLDINSLDLEGQYTKNDLVRWNNKLVEFLKNNGM